MNSRQPREKGTKENPFYMLSFEWDKKNEVLRIDPYLLLSRNALGPKLILKEFMPDISFGISTNMPIYLWHREKSGAISLEFNGNELMKLAYKVEHENYVKILMGEEINAALILGFTNYRGLGISEDEAIGFITPVQFFHIEIKLPEQIKREDIKIFKDYGLL